MIYIGIYDLKGIKGIEGLLLDKPVDPSMHEEKAASALQKLEVDFSWFVALDTLDTEAPLFVKGASSVSRGALC